ncbi:hypothetical protein ABZ912_23295 [Nonomuraea angiospora]|uniref:hypothetical protein n=1 Tax=Nonomuraea angiospora TaxID=46172 RepID=UPI0033F1D275
MIVSEILFTTAIAAALAVVSLSRRTPALCQACSPQERQLLALFIRDEIDEEEYRHRRALTGRAPDTFAFARGAPGDLRSGEPAP